MSEQQNTALPQAAAVTFRECEEADLEWLQPMVDQFYLDVWGSSDGRPAVAATFAELRQKPDKGRIVVFEHGQDGPIGYAILINFWSNEFQGDIVDVDEIFVDRQQRNLGISSVFFSWLERSLASAAGFSLQVAPTNDRAARLYERLGFKDTGNRHLIKVREEQPVRH